MCYTPDNSGYFKVGQGQRNGKQVEYLAPYGTRFCEACDHYTKHRVADKFICPQCADDRCPKCASLLFKHEPVMQNMASFSQPPEWSQLVECEQCGWREVIG